MVVIVAMMIVPMTIIPMILASVVPVVAAMTAMLLTVVRSVVAAIPVILHKIDAFTASVVAAAMLAPVSRVTRRYAHIDRSTRYFHALDGSRLTIDHPWLRVWIVANIDAAIESGIADTERNANIGCKRRRGEGGNGYCRCH